MVKKINRDRLVAVHPLWHAVRFWTSGKDTIVWGCSSAGEHCLRKAGAVGSNPIISTIPFYFPFFLDRQVDLMVMEASSIMLQVLKQKEA
jgi:hypothetical protein